MILVITGLERFPFDRLLAMIDEGLERKILNGPVFAQSGRARYKPRLFAAEPFWPLNRLRKAISEADLIVTHAGVGSVVQGLRAGKKIIAVPRQRARFEHVDDHQEEFADRMERTGKIRVARTEEEFFRIAAELNSAQRPDPPPARSLPSREGLLDYLGGLLVSARAGLEGRRGP